MTDYQQTMLGKITPLPESPSAAVLDTVPNRGTVPYGVRLTVPEFTSLCPITGAPDFAHIVVDYSPNQLLVESKSFKLFMGSFRNHGEYHEACTNLIADRLWDAMTYTCDMLDECVFPYWLVVSAYWFPRGGIPIDVFVQRGTRPYQVEMPPITIPTYRGR